MKNSKNKKSSQQHSQNRAPYTGSSGLPVSDDLKPNLVKNGPDNPDDAMLTTSEIIDFSQGADS